MYLLLVDPEDGTTTIQMAAHSKEEALLNPDLKLAGIAWGKTSRPFRLNKITGPLRRALIYGAVSYGGLVLINNSELDLPNMWIAYLPMFVGVYVLTQWLDRKFGG